MADDWTGNLYANTARLYDLDPRWTDAEIKFYKKWAEEINGDILELACGTGRLTIPLAEAGYEILGLELSEEMIREFEIKLRKLKNDRENSKVTATRIHLIKKDMSEFKIKDEENKDENKKFPLILLPCRSFQLLIDKQKERNCLKSIHNHLEEDGTFIIDIGNFLKDIGPEWGNEPDVERPGWEVPKPGTTDETITRTHKQKLIDRENQIISVELIYRVIGTDGGLIEGPISEKQRLRYFREEKIKERLSKNGFQVVQSFGSYDEKPINEKESPEFIFVCKKTKES